MQSLLYERSIDVSVEYIGGDEDTDHHKAGENHKPAVAIATLTEAVVHAIAYAGQKREVA